MISRTPPMSNTTAWMVMTSMMSVAPGARSNGERRAPPGQPMISASQVIAGCETFPRSRTQVEPCHPVPASLTRSPANSIRLINPAQAETVTAPIGCMPKPGIDRPAAAKAQFKAAKNHDFPVNGQCRIPQAVPGTS